MGCGCGENSGGFSASESYNSISELVDFSGINEQVVPAIDISSEDPEENSNMLLESGQYRVKFRAEITNEQEAEPFTLRNFTIDVPVENEYKRVKVFKMDSIPTSETERLVTVKMAVIDNPVWLAPVLWTLPAVGGWFVVDKVENFADSSPINFSLITITAFGALAAFFIK